MNIIVAGDVHGAIGALYEKVHELQDKVDMSHGLVKEGLEKIAEKFASEKHVGPKFVAEFEDKELSFQGPASLEVFDAWKQRFERLREFPLFLGKDLAREVSQEFLDCLLRDDHACTAKVIMVVGRHAKIT